ncbi:short-chain dehydrogenase/reductase sDR, partial [gut metagenome]
MRTVAICGATGGIGQALVHAYAEPGTRLLLAGRNSDVLKKLQQDCRAEGLEVDIEAFDIRDTVSVTRWCQKAVDCQTTRLILAAGVSASVEAVRLSDGRTVYWPETTSD